MKIIVKKKSEISKSDLVVYCMRQTDEPQKGFDIPPDLLGFLTKALASGDFVAKEGETLLCYPQTTGKKNMTDRFMMVGLGKDQLSREIFRKCGGTIACAAQKTKATTIVVVLPEELDFPIKKMSQSLAEGLILGNYKFLHYKSSKKDDEPPRAIIEAIFCCTKLKETKSGVEIGLRGANAACRARDMANEPANQWTPGHFATFAQALAKDHGLKCTVLGKAELTKLKMGGILGVAQGTAEPPKMVVLEYHSNKKVPSLLLVGKGLTFDSGGISIKPSLGMHEMKYDMCGGAAVLSCMEAVALERPQGLNIIAIVPATDNMPGPGALKPGDIVRQYNGKTVEIISTDAEGRLLLADALAYGIKKFKPDMVVDLATLTGAVIVGLGHHISGMMSNDDALTAKLDAAGRESGEPVWRLPLNKDYSKQIESKVADLKNVGDQGAGTITAGAFLQEFVGETAWVHLDIAGTAWNFTEKSYVPKGPSGIGVRLLLELIRSW
ncbi:MAG: leucyl aminopeptidase [Desulfobulbaceae bacterium]|nr:leucyl aminopeptidase [Desulfobulbaceae bacterium]